MTVEHVHRFRSTGKPGPQITERCESCGQVRLVDRPEVTRIDRARVLSELQDRLYCCRVTLEAVRDSHDIDQARAEAERALERIGPVMCPPNQGRAAA